MKIGDIVRHYKGSRYKILHFAIFSSDDPVADGTLAVVYQSVDTNRIYCTSLDRMVSTVATPRFTKEE